MRMQIELLDELVSGFSQRFWMMKWRNKRRRSSCRRWRDENKEKKRNEIENLRRNSSHDWQDRRKEGWMLLVSVWGTMYTYMCVYILFDCMLWFMDWCVKRVFHTHCVWERIYVQTKENSRSWKWRWCWLFPLFCYWIALNSCLYPKLIGLFRFQIINLTSI